MLKNSFFVYLSFSWLDKLGCIIFDGNAIWYFENRQTFVFYNTEDKNYCKENSFIVKELVSGEHF